MWQLSFADKRQTAISSSKMQCSADNARGNLKWQPTRTDRLPPIQDKPRQKWNAMWQTHLQTERGYSAKQMTVKPNRTRMWQLGFPGDHKR